MALAPTLTSVEALYRKLEREAYRAYHSRSRIHKADHFFNFCVTAHSVRDYFFERKGLIGKKLRAPYNQCWESDSLVAAVADIANTTKHFTLRFPDGQPRPIRTRRARTKRGDFVDIFASREGVVRVPATLPDVTVTLSDGTRYALYQFTANVLESWRLFLSREGIRIRRQSLRQVIGKSAHVLSLFTIVAGLLAMTASKVERQYTRIQTEDGLETGGLNCPWGFESHALRLLAQQLRRLAGIQPSVPRGSLDQPLDQFDRKILCRAQLASGATRATS